MSDYAPFLTRRAALSLASLFVAISTFAQSDVTQPGDPIVGTSGNTPTSEVVANAIDNAQTKYLNFDKLNTGFTVTPSVGATIVTGITLESANDAPERDPASYILSGSNDGGVTFEDIASGDVPIFSGRYVTQKFTFTNNKAYKAYKLIFPTVANPDTANSMQIAEVELLGTVVPPDVTQPGDPIVGTSGNTPTSEVVANAIDNAQTKYLNFDKLNTGFTVTPSVGATIVTGLTLESANDAPERDPASYVLSGSNDGTTFTDIASGDVPVFSGRYVTQQFFFPNTQPYKMYRLIFPTVANPTTANSMQIAEVELLGTVAPQDVTQPGDPIVGTSGNTPTSEVVANAIDNAQTKYLNFDKLNTGFTVTPSVGKTIVTGLTLESANDAPERDPASYVLSGSNDGTTFTQIAAGDVPIFSGRYVTQQFFFDNSTAYTSYKLIFPTVANPTTANSMQIAEVELLGFAAGSSALPQFKAQPQDTPVLLGASANFKVVVNGPWQIQWYTNGVAIPGATQLTYTTPPTTAADDNTAYYAVAKNGALTSQSDTVHLHIFTPSATKSISINFRGSGANGAPTDLAPTDIAGVWQQAYWNNADGNSGELTTDTLTDSDNNPSDIVVDYQTTATWGSGTGGAPTDSGDRKMLNGFMDPQNGNMATVTFSSLPAGNYRIISYSINRPSAFNDADYSVAGATTPPTIHVRAQNSDEYNAAPGYVRGTSTDPNARAVANYVQFDDIAPDSSGTITFTAQSYQEPGETPPGTAPVNGIQLVFNPPAQGNPPALTTAPDSKNVTAGTTF
jgi:hypothetical protein